MITIQFANGMESHLVDLKIFNDHPMSEVLMVYPGEIAEIPDYGYPEFETIHIEQTVLIRDIYDYDPGNIRSPAQFLSNRAFDLSDEVHKTLVRRIDYEIEKCQGWFSDIFIVIRDGDSFISSFNNMRECTVELYAHTEFAIAVVFA